MPIAKHKTTCQIYTFRGQLETVHAIFDSNAHQSLCAAIGVVRSYWEARNKESLRMDIYRASDKVKLCAIHASVTEEVVTLFADDEGVMPDLLATITSQIKDGDVFHSQFLDCAIRFDE